jgi:hypothetical protein
MGVAFGRSSLGVGKEDPVDAAVRLEVNHWNGSVEPRIVLRELYPLEDEDAPGAGAPLHTCDCGEEEWLRRFELELGRDLESPAGDGVPAAATRRVVRGGGSATTAIAELVSSGAGVLAVCADASRRAALASGASGLARFNGGAALIACHRCGRAQLEGLAARGGGGLALTDFAALQAAPDLAARFEHVVLVDPPRSPADQARVEHAREGQPAGFLHTLWTPAELAFSIAALGEQTASRPAVAAVFRALRQAGDGTLREALAAGGAYPLGPEAAGRCFRVLKELELVSGEPGGGNGAVGVVSSEGTDLERSAAFRVYRADHSEAQQYLERHRQP